MKGLLLKDIFSLKKQMVQFLLFPIFYLILALSSSGMGYIMGMMTLLLPMYVFSSFYYDDMVKWTQYAGALPLGRKQIVLSKYLLGILLTLVGAVISLISGVVLCAIISEISFGLYVLSVLAFMMVGLLYNSFLLPLIFRFGSEKGRLLSILVMAIIGAIVGALGGIFWNKLDIPQLSFQNGTIQLMIGAAFLAVLLVFSLSVMISIRIFQKKEL